MSDHTSAGIFAKLFTLLAKNPTDEHKEIARKMWPERNEYDFSDYQMGCDKALIALGLAKKGPDGIEYAGK